MFIDSAPLSRVSKAYIVEGASGSYSERFWINFYRE